MTKFVIFTNDELDAIKEGTPVSVYDSKNNTNILYVSEEYYNNLMQNCKDKEIEDD